MAGDLELAFKHHEVGEMQQALFHYEIALAGGQVSAVIHNNIGMIQRDMGQITQAAMHFSKAIALNSKLGPSYFGRTGLRKYQAENDADKQELQEMRLLLADKTLDQGSRIPLLFGTGKVLDDFERWDEAFDVYAEGNRLVGIKWNERETQQGFDSLKDFFTKELCAEIEGGNASDAPIFVVGMMRSGTTVVHQIISSHPDAAGAGEYQGLPKSWHHLIEMGMDSSEQNFQKIAALYLQGLPESCRNKKKFVDKLPSNFMNLGMAAMLFPNASIIHCRRDPMDTCLSNYFQLYMSGIPYAYDLQNLGRYFRLYQDLIGHFEQVLPLKIHTVNYEDLVLHPQEVIPELVDFCGLEWDEQCLAFHKNPDPIWTASSVQARQPLYKESIGRWRHYEKNLGPLQQALGKLLED